MKKINFNKSQIIVATISVLCMSFMFLRNYAYSSPFEYIWVNGEEHCVEHNAVDCNETWTTQEYLNYLRVNGKNWNLSDSLAITNAGPGIMIHRMNCKFKNMFQATCDKNYEGFWLVAPNDCYVQKLTD